MIDQCHFSEDMNEKVKLTSNKFCFKLIKFTLHKEIIVWILNITRELALFLK